MEDIQYSTIDENIVHLDDEIDRADLEGLERMALGDIIHQINGFVLPEGPDAIVLDSRRFLTDTFSFEGLNVRFSSLSSVSMVEGKRQWQAQSKPKHIAQPPTKDQTDLDLANKTTRENQDIHDGALGLSRN